MSPSMKGTQKMIENLYIWHKQSTYLYYVWFIHWIFHKMSTEILKKSREKKCFCI
jgi:hypothetical protein